jgi:putative hydrolase of the HAD superfamily
LKKLTQTIRAVVFDLDDTLYPEIAYVQSGYRVIAAVLAGGDWDQNRFYDLLWQEFEQGDRRRVFNTVLRHLGKNDAPEEITRLIEIYRQHRPELTLDREVKEILDTLTIRYKLGLITDGFLPAQKLKVEALELESFFDSISYTEELGREYWKPATYAFEIMSQKLECDPDQCVYVADNPAKDFIAPNQLGWQSIQLQCDWQIYKDNPAPPESQAQTTIHSLSTLLEIA